MHVGISGPKIFHSCGLINISGGRPKGLVGSIMSAVLSRKIASKQKKWRPKARLESFSRRFGTWRNVLECFAG